MKILLAEDDNNLGKLLKALLGKEGIDVDWVEDGQAAYAKVYSAQYDVLVLDWMMPKLSGLELVQHLREEEYEGKILLLTARDAVADRVTGLESGADDYLVKPFEMVELVARLKALARRPDQLIMQDLTCGNFTLSSQHHALIYEDRYVELTPREYRLLEMFFQNKGRVLPREYVQDRIWGIESEITGNNLDVYVRKLRQKIAALTDETLIETMRGVGYRVNE